MQIFRVNPLFQATKQQLNGEKCNLELRHLSAFGWAILFSCPVQCLEKYWHGNYLLFAQRNRPLHGVLANLAFVKATTIQLM